MDISPEIKDRVTGAIESLIADGVEEPTNQQILKKMGKGSYAHVSPVAKEWRRNRKEQLKAALALPDALQTVLNKAGSTLWLRAQELSEQKYIQFKQDCKNEVDDITSEKEEAITEIVRLESEISTKNDKITEITLENEILRSDLSKQATQAEFVNEELVKEKKESEGIRLELVRKTEAFDQTSTQLTSLKDDYAKLQKQLVELAKNK